MGSRNLTCSHILDKLLDLREMDYVCLFKHRNGLPHQSSQLTREQNRNGDRISYDHKHMNLVSWACSHEPTHVIAFLFVRCDDFEYSHIQENYFLVGLAHLRLSRELLVACHLKISKTMRIHSIFHVSLLKCSKANGKLKFLPPPIMEIQSVL